MAAPIRDLRHLHPLVGFIPLRALMGLSHAYLEWSLFIYFVLYATIYGNIMLDPRLMIILESIIIGYRLPLYTVSATIHIGETDVLH